VIQEKFDSYEPSPYGSKTNEIRRRDAVSFPGAFSGVLVEQIVEVEHKRRSNLPPPK
jgi:hypothetical protein